MLLLLLYSFSFQHNDNIFWVDTTSVTNSQQVLKGPLGRDGGSFSLPLGGRMRFSCILHTRDSCASIPGHAGSPLSSATQAPLFHPSSFLSASQWGRPLFSLPFLLLLRFFALLVTTSQFRGFVLSSKHSAVNGRTTPSLHTTKCRRNCYYLLLLKSPRRG